MAPAPGKNPVVFLDRDGVINADSPDYIKSWAEFRFLPGAVTAVKRLCDAGFSIFVITNQSGVGRGLISPAELDHIHAEMRRTLAARGAEIKDVFHCPHLPGDGCACRKPRPGLILRACDVYGLDPAESVMVGDKWTDAACGGNAGCRYALLVGNAGETRGDAENGVRLDGKFRELLEAADWIISHF